MLKEFIIAIRAYFDAFRFIKKHQLWKWILIPGILYCTLLISGYYLFVSSYNDVTKWMIETLKIKNWLDRFEDSWLSFFFILSKVFLDLLLFFACFSIYKFILLIFGSPIFSCLSEKTESLILEKNFSINKKNLISDCKRAITVVYRNLSRQGVYLLSFILVCAIPIAGWITPLILIALDCYYIGFSMLDYGYARSNVSQSTSFEQITHHRGLAIGNGMVFYFLHIIPIAGWIFAPGYAIIAATLSIHRAKKANIIA